MKIAIIGAGISGIAFASVLKQFGHDCVVFDKATKVGGIWALTYPHVRLQNTREQYTFSDFPWPHTPDQHPTAKQILDYLESTVTHYELDVRLEHNVTKMLEKENGWSITTTHQNLEQTLDFDYAVISIGQYAEQKHRPEFPGEADFSGEVLTERDIKSFDIFRGKTVAVVGFGKSAVDVCSFAAPSARSVSHVFRTPRWLIPFRIFGFHYSYVFFARVTTIFMPSWVHATRVERALHQYGSRLVKSVWKAIESIVRRKIRRHARNRSARALESLQCVTPTHSFARDLRSATAMAPVDYYRHIADGVIKPFHAEVQGFDTNSMLLSDGTRVEADVVVLSVGSATPQFPFLPDNIRRLLEQESDGVQLYRHLTHPRISNMAFAGYNHGFMHIPAAEIGALWLCAVWRGDLVFPSVEAQEKTINAVQKWKRDNINFEPSRACAVNTRFHQYIDAMLIELGISPYRKMPNILKEIFARYGGADYEGIVEDVLNNPPQNPRAMRNFDT